MGFGVEIAGLSDTATKGPGQVERARVIARRDVRPFFFCFLFFIC